MSAHVVLLGDSIFANTLYTGGEPDVVAHLRSRLSHVWRATLAAVDGARCVDLADQLAAVPDDATDFVVSIGGNDALYNADLMSLPVGSTAEAIRLFAQRLATFERDYRAALDAVRALGLRTAVCTIYDGNLDPSEAPLARQLLKLFNDTILRYAIENALPVLDLRFVCTEPSDYANPIEPSGQGGAKIAAGIVRVLDLSDDRPHASVHGPAHGRGPFRVLPSPRLAPLADPLPPRKRVPRSEE